jgi:tetratricopeptide (TPR) repeat protein
VVVKSCAESAFIWETSARNGKPNRASIARSIYSEATRLQKLGHLPEAYEGYRNAIKIYPDFPEALSRLGFILCDQGYFQDAVECCRRALDIKHKSMDALVILCRALTQMGRVDEVREYCRAAITRHPFATEPLVELGRVYRHIGRLDESISCLKRAAALKPHLADIHTFLGFVLRERGHFQEAAASCYEAIRLDPNSADAHGNLAIALLSMGRMSEGWKEYEWRWKTPGLVDANRGFRQPQWLGEEARDRTLLIHAEQGLGDTLHFCRYASLAAERGFRVILEAQQPLKKLMCGLPGISRVLERGESLPEFDLHCPMLSLPLAFATDLTNIPSATPYLTPDEASVLLWKNRLAKMAVEDLRVGLAWAGGKILEADRRRSIPLEILLPIADVPGVRLFSLQKDAPNKSKYLVDFMDEVSDFSDTASLVANLDLVISVDTAVAHLAASMGKPCWLLNRFDSCWRWLRDRCDSPWYPTLRLYNQPRAGDWGSVIEQVISDLFTQRLFFSKKEILPCPAR